MTDEGSVAIPGTTLADQPERILGRIFHLTGGIAVQRMGTAPRPRFSARKRYGSAMKRWAVAGLAMLVISLSLWATGCSCETSHCETPETSLEFEGTLIDREGDVFTFLPIGESESVEILVETNPQVLDIDSDYAVSAVSSPEGSQAEWLGAVNPGCSCPEGRITYADGSAIDTGIWQGLSFPKGPIIALLAIPVLAIVVVTMGWAFRRLLRSS